MKKHGNHFFVKTSLTVFCVALFSACISQSSKSDDDTVFGSAEDIAKIAYIGDEKINTKACVPFQIRLLDKDEQILTANEDIPISVTITGATKIYIDETCQNEVDEIIVEQNDYRGSGYLKGEQVENFTLKAQEKEIVDLAVTQFFQGYVDGLDGTVHTLENVQNNKTGVYAGGDFSEIQGQTMNRMARILTDGNVDATFDLGEGFSFTVYEVIDNGIHIYAAGQFTTFQGSSSTGRIARLTPTGQRDASFSSGNFSGNGARTIKVVEDAIFIGGGFNQYNMDNPGKLFKLNLSGSLNTSFDTEDALNGTVEDLIVLDDGSVIAAGNFFTPSPRIVKFDPQGNVDADFDVGIGFDATAYAVAVDSNGKVYVGGNFNTYNGEAVGKFVRLNADGSLDADFAENGFNSFVYTITIDKQNKVYVGGSFTQYQGQAVDEIVRLNTNGSLDTTFDTGSGFTGSPTKNVRAIEITNDHSGDLWVGGRFDTYQDQPVSNLVRVTDTGEID